ncbi:MAG: DedA family protein [Solirubrobacteraceae bacterium]|nr:DedA family protein [Solirubrobacteraceae bacterium]
MSSAADWVVDTVESGGYPALGGLILLENVFPPIPSELILPLAGFSVGRGDMVFVLAVLAATIGSVVGALILYGAARAGGRPLIYRFGPKVRLSHKDLDRADAWFDRYGVWFVLFGRLIPGVRSLVSVPAGLSEMPLAWFVALTAIGSAVWNALLIGIGRALGENWDELAAYIGPISTFALIGMLAGMLALAIWLLRRGREPQTPALS